MAYQLNCQDLLPVANQRYLAAIRSLGVVIRSSLQANNAANQSLTDETLQSVLLLDLYEKMAYQPLSESEFPSSWLSHIQGALSIVRSRPTAGFSNPTTQQLATRTVIALTLSCGAAGIPIPEALIGLAPLLKQATAAVKAQETRGILRPHLGRSSIDYFTYPSASYRLGGESNSVAPFAKSSRIVSPSFERKHIHFND
jgi:hypothetical protein